MRIKSLLINLGLFLGALSLTLGAQIIITPIPFTPGGSGTITGGTCTNQFVRSIDTSGTPTCATVVSTDLGSSLSLTTPNINVASGTSLTLSSLTATRLVFAGTAGILDDDAALFWDDSLKQLSVTADGLFSAGTYKIGAYRIPTETSGKIYVADFIQEPGPTGNTSGEYYGLKAGVSTGTNFNFTNQVTGANLYAQNDGNGTYNFMTGVEADSFPQGSGTKTHVSGTYSKVENNGTGTHTGFGVYGKYDTLAVATVNLGTGLYGISQSHAAASFTEAVGAYGKVENLSTGTITLGAALYAGLPLNSGGGTFTTAYGVWIANQTLAGGTSDYALWYNGGGGDCNAGGVTRVNHFGIFAYYNPCFAAYVPDAVNFERIIIRFGDTGVFGTDNIAYMGMEVGGSGTNKVLNILGSSVGIQSVPGTYAPLTASTINANALFNLPTRQSVTVDGATTFAITSSYITLACTGAETINTITGGSVGTILYIDHGDTDCTLASDPDPTAANAMALLASDVGAVNKTIVLMHNGTYWQELSESDNQ